MTPSRKHEPYFEVHERNGRGQRKRERLKSEFGLKWFHRIWMADKDLRI